MDLICFVLWLYWLAILAVVLMSWVPITPGSGIEQFHNALSTITEPVLAPLRRAIPPVRIGGAALDLSPIIVFIGLAIIRGQIC